MAVTKRYYKVTIDGKDEYMATLCDVAIEATSGIKSVMGKDLNQIKWMFARLKEQGIVYKVEEEQRFTHMKFKERSEQKPKEVLPKADEIKIGGIKFN